MSKKTQKTQQRLATTLVSLKIKRPSETAEKLVAVRKTYGYHTYKSYARTLKNLGNKHPYIVARKLLTKYELSDVRSEEAIQKSNQRFHRTFSF